MADSLTYSNFDGGRYETNQKTLVTTILAVLGLHALIGVGLMYIKTVQIPPNKVTPPIEVSFIEPQSVEAPAEVPAETAGEPEPAPPTPEPVKPTPKPAEPPKAEPPKRVEPAKPEPVKPTPKPPEPTKVEQTKPPEPQIDQQKIIQQQEQARQAEFARQEQARQAAAAEAARQAAAAEAARQQAAAAEAARQAAAAEAARQQAAAAAAAAAQKQAQQGGGGGSNERVSLPSSNGIWQRPPSINFPENLAQQINDDKLESVSVRVEFDHTGKVTGCSVTNSSGNGRVDNFVCQRVRAAKVKPPVRNGSPAGGDAPFTVNLKRTGR